MSTSSVASTVSSITLNASTQNVTEFVATANQTTFSITYTPNAILVFLNGILLDNGVDYTATNGTSVVLTNGAAVNDVLTVDKGNYTFSATSAVDPATAAFKTISVSGQSDVVADSATDTLTFAAGSNMTITTAAGSDTITLASATQLTDNSVTTAKIADDAVTSAKLANAVDITTSLGVGGGSTNGVAISQGAIALKNGGTRSNIDFYCESNNAHYTRIQAAPHASYSGNITLTLPASTGTSGQVMTTDGSGNLSFATVGGAYSDWSIKTSNYTAVAKDQLICNHASTPFTITLPAGSTGATITICNAGAATVTIGRNGSEKINSAAEDGTLPQGNSAQLVYVDGTIGWFEV